MKCRINKKYLVLLFLFFIASLFSSFVIENITATTANQLTEQNSSENRFANQPQDVEPLNKERQILYDKIKEVVSKDKLRQLQKNYQECQNDQCRTIAVTKYHQKEQQAGNKLVSLYQSGQLTKADIEQLVSWYNDSQIGGTTQPTGSAGTEYKLLAPNDNRIPLGLINQSHLAEIRGLMLLDEWRAEGLSESQLQEKFLQEDVLGSFGEDFNSHFIVYQIQHNGLSLEDALNLATTYNILNQQAKEPLIVPDRGFAKYKSAEKYENVKDADKTGNADKKVADENKPIVPVEGLDLDAHEAAGGHLMARHIGKTKEELLNRLSRDNIKTASSFTDKATAEAIVSKALNANQGKIKKYLSGSQRGYLIIDYKSSKPIGISISRGQTNVSHSSNVRIIIKRDPSMPTGYTIVTGYPTS